MQAVLGGAGLAFIGARMGLFGKNIVELNDVNRDMSWDIKYTGIQKKNMIFYTRLNTRFEKYTAGDPTGGKVDVSMTEVFLRPVEVYLNDVKR